MQTIATLTATTNLMEFDVRVGSGITLGEPIGLVRQAAGGVIEGRTARGFWETYESITEAVRGVLFPVVGEASPIIVYGTRD